MLKGLAIGVEHFPDYQPYKSGLTRMGSLYFSPGLNVILCSAIEQMMTDEEFDRYSRDFAICVPTIGRSNVRFEEICVPTIGRSNVRFEEIVFG